MRRKRTEHKKLNTEIFIINISDTLSRIEHYTIDGGLEKELINTDKAWKRVEEIKKERKDICIWDNGKATYPFRR